MHFSQEACAVVRQWSHLKYNSFWSTLAQVVDGAIENNADANNGVWPAFPWLFDGKSWRVIYDPQRDIAEIDLLVAP